MALKPITENDLWHCRIENVERLARCLGVEVTDDMRAAWGGDWRGKLIAMTVDALRVDAVRAKAERDHWKRNGYVVRDSRAR